MSPQTTPPTADARVIEIVFDCDDPERLATFWNALLGLDIKGRVRELSVGDLEHAARQVMSLGGRELATHDERGRRWKVMVDPEGNEFCLTIAS